MSSFRFSSATFAVASVAGFSSFVSSPAPAAQFAATISYYTPGTYTGAYRTGSSAAGSPDDLTGEAFGFANILSPFSPPYDSNELVGIGKGGSVSMRFATPVNISTRRELNVFTNIGLVDANYGSGQNTNPASTFSKPRAANVSISADGKKYFDLGRIDFDAPTNYFANASSPYLTSAPANPVLADFGTPFRGTLSSFNGKTWQQTLTVLGGTAGGESVDVPTSFGLTQFSFVRFSIPSAGFSNTDSQFFLDAVAVNNASRSLTAGASLLSAGSFGSSSFAETSNVSAVPEPTSVAVIGLASATLLLRRRRREAR